jgi:hypothetical protein
MLPNSLWVNGFMCVYMRIQQVIFALFSVSYRHITVDTLWIKRGEIVLFYNGRNDAAAYYPAGRNW